MHLAALLILSPGFAPAPFLPGRLGAETGLKALRGEWALVEESTLGAKRPPDAPCVNVYSGGTLTIRTGAAVGRCMVTITGQGEMDMVLAPGQGDAGERMEVLYRLEGDRLTVGYLGTWKRPDSLKQAEAYGFVRVFKRVRRDVR